ncbi:MAG: ATP-binding protein [Rhodobacter sp.]|nr:ATP-binding protein [Rhodobacter sp.]
MDALGALDRVNSAIAGASSMDEMLQRVLDQVLEIFACDRAWLAHPCDLDDDFLTLREERVRPGWPGAKADAGGVPIDDRSRRFREATLAAKTPVRFDPLTNPVLRQDSQAARRYRTRSMMTMPLRPKAGSPWIFGIHHCAQEVTYELAAPLFDAIGKRLAEGLTTFNAIEEIRRSEERYRALVDHATEAIVILDVDTGVFMEANPAAARLYGIPVDDLIGKHGPATVSPELQPDGRRSVNVAMAHVGEALAGAFPRFEWVHRRADGTDVPCDISLARFPDPTRKLVRGSIIDITERKRSERQRFDLETRLAQAQKLETVGQMTGGVAHDFNNLLNVVLGNLELLHDEVADAELKSWIDAAISATIRGADLTQKMLSFARRAHLDPSVLDLTEIVQETGNWMARTLPATIMVKTELAPDLWPVEADRASTESSLLNLIVNARDAMPDGGILTIETANSPFLEHPEDARLRDLPPGNYAMLAVSDTGIGIQKANTERVFEPFFTTKRPGEGSGLGLSMVHGFMKQSGGAAVIYSEPGQGTTVKLYFPVPVGAGARGTTETAVRDAAVVHRPARVLMAEDQVEVMDVMMRVLRTAGYAVTPAASGDAAKKLFLAEGPFDLLITDIVMPGRLQGPALARELREIAPELPVVFMSGYAREAAMHGNGLREEDIRLMKPVTRAKLLGAVREALG